jgi:ribosome-associated protein
LEGNWLIDLNEMEFEYYRSPGPGGQNVNKVSTGVRLRFNIHRSRSLRQDTKDRLMQIAGARITSEGELIIEAHRYRTRERNQQDAVARLEAFLDRAAHPPKKRHRTRPTRTSIEKRLESKRFRSKIKRGRKGEE